ncbi:MAG: hypothetical protein RLZZ129_30 [Verrucomicrobiota bacterium]
MKLTKTTVKNLLPPEPETADSRRGYSLSWDDDLRGFGVLVTVAGVKSYIVRARIHGRERRHTLGRCNVLSTDAARELAVAWLGQIAAGGDPVTAKKRRAAEAVTVAEALRRYAGLPRLAAGTQRLVLGALDGAFADWRDLPLTRIDAGMVERKHAAVSETSPGAATVAFRYFRAAWNEERIRSKDASGEYLLPECPTRALSEKRLWNRHARRQRAIEPQRTAEWFQAVESLSDIKARIFFKLCLYLGCRRDELARLVWDDVHLDGGYCVFRHTKAGKHHATPDHHQPLPGQAIHLLQALRDVSVGPCVLGDSLGRYRGTSAFTTEITKVRELFGPFGPHDCRRTFISTAEVLGVPSLTTKKLVNHATTADVTGGYYVATVAALRPVIQRIADTLDSYRQTGDNVVPLRQAAPGA